MWRQRMLILIFAGLFLLSCVSREVVPVDSQAEISIETKYVALTFDDGPRQGTTDRLLDGLRQRGASVTFFLVGEQAELYPDLVKRMQAEGHQVGNHTWSHGRLEGIPVDQILTEIAKSETLLEEMLGGKNYWLRPPYGLIDPKVAEKVTVPMVKWSIDPRDWESRNTDKVVQAVLKDVKPNSIILLHDIYPTSVDAALKIIDELQTKGYLFVTVEELLRLNGVTPEAGVLYRSGTGA